MGGVGDELALGLIAAELVGAVADDEQRRALGGQVAGADRVGAVADADVIALGAAAVGRAADPGAQRVDDRAVIADQLLRGRVGEADVAVGIDDDHRLVERGEDRRETVALGGERVEGLGEGDPHRVERPAEVADLIPPARVHRGVEMSFGELAGGGGEPLDPRGDQAGDEEADQPSDQHRDDQRRQPLPGQCVERRLDLLGALRDRQQHPGDALVADDDDGDHRPVPGQVRVDVEIPLERRRDGAAVAADRVDVEAGDGCGGDQLRHPGRRVVVEPGAEVLGGRGVPDRLDRGVRPRQPSRRELRLDLLADAQRPPDGEVLGAALGGPLARSGDDDVDGRTGQDPDRREHQPEPEPDAERSALLDRLDRRTLAGHRQLRRRRAGRRWRGCGHLPLLSRRRPRRHPAAPRPDGRARRAPGPR